jgi:hypothetical protein
MRIIRLRECCGWCVAVARLLRTVSGLVQVMGHGDGWVVLKLWLTVGGGCGLLRKYVQTHLLEPILALEGGYCRLDVEQGTPELVPDARHCAQCSHLFIRPFTHPKSIHHHVWSVLRRQGLRRPRGDVDMDKISHSNKRRQTLKNNVSGATDKRRETRHGLSKAASAGDQAPGRQAPAKTSDQAGPAAPVAAARSTRGGG